MLWCRGDGVTFDGNGQAFWSDRLAQWIAELVNSHVPFLGICYGHQLLAQAMGGTVDYHPLGQEIGTVEIDLLPASSTDHLFQGLSVRFPVHVSHSQTVLSLPKNATRLAANSFDSCHAMRIGDCAWGVQFHPEFDTRVMKSYVEEQAKEIEAEGRNLTEIYRTIRDTHEAASILRRFAEIARRGQSDKGR